jgi:hypothetical protein
MTDFTVSVHCCLCPAQHEQTIKLPHGWAGRHDGVDAEDGFCPSHIEVKDWADSQCPGCVSGWGDCPLWEAFAFSKLTLTEADFQSIERGTCPKRVNGTLMLSGGHLSKIDLSERGPTASGIALVQAIRAYVAEYHTT